MSVFDVLNTGTVTIVRCDADADGTNAPVANYLNADGTVNGATVVEADIPAQVEYHRDRLLGNEVNVWDQPVSLAQRDVWVAGPRDELGDTGSGFGVVFEDGRFGRITAVERDHALGGLPESILLVVKVVGAMP